MSPLWSTYPGYTIPSLSAVVQSKAARHHRVPQRTDLSLVPSFSELIELKGAFLAEIDFFCPLDTAIEDHVDDFCCTCVNRVLSLGRNKELIKTDKSRRKEGGV